jgi:hypothetical protein
VLIWPARLASRWLGWFAKKQWECFSRDMNDYHEDMAGMAMGMASRLRACSRGYQGYLFFLLRPYEQRI